VDFWHVLPIAIALVFIVEGMLPFISPNHWRTMLAMAEQLDNQTIRYVGLGSMSCGVILLYFVH
jgi:uncharacterized protein YjeT (DUF2065 family)